jgi:hypothetical protein
VAIVVLVLWFATVGAGIALLRAGGAARRLAAGPITAPKVVAKPALPALAMQPAASGPARIGAIPLTEDGKPPRVPHARVATPPGEHPLLEFLHPALAVTGLAFWAMFTFVHSRPMAWTAVAIQLVTISLGLAWQARNRMASRRRASSAWPFPGRLLTLHVTVAASAFVLAVLAALVASHG